MSSCTITFWEDNDFKGDKRTYDGYTENSTLRDDNYEGKHGMFGGMFHTINSLKTGSAAWLCAFTSESYQFNALKVGPSRSIENLHSEPMLGDTGWRNEIGSFILYDKQPNFWSTTDSTRAGDCWLKIYAKAHFSGSVWTVYGAGKVRNTASLDDFCYLYTDKYNQSYIKPIEPLSLSTGPATWVMLYDVCDGAEILNRVPIAQFGPNSLVDDLSRYTQKELYSLVVYDAQTVPSTFSASVQTPTQVLAFEHHQTSLKLQNALSMTLGMLPYGGGAARALLQALWPSGPSANDVWLDLSHYMNELLRSMSAQYELAGMTDFLNKMGDSIQFYVDAEAGLGKATQLNDILKTLYEERRNFINSQNPEQTLPYLVAYGTMCLVMLAERVYNYTSLSAGGVDTKASQMRRDLDKDIETLTDAVEAAATKALAWRLAKIYTKKATDGNSYYVVLDDYTGYQQVFDREADAKATVQRLSDRVRTEYSVQLTAYTNPARWWGYLHTSNAETTGATTTFRVKPALQQVTVATGSYAGHHSASFEDQLNASRVTKIILTAGHSGSTYVRSIEFKYDEQASGSHQDANPLAETSRVEAALDNGEEIVAVYGGSGSFLNRLFFRTNKGRDIGLGGSSGEVYMAAKPQGVGARLVSMKGSTSDGVLSELSLIWQYDTVAPYTAS